MIIDDDEPTNYISSMLIEESGCTRNLKIEDSALKALDYLKRQTTKEKADERPILPDIIFLDINMPCMNGWEFLEAYQKLETPLPKKPVIIMLTTSMHPNDKMKACNVPEISGFECKPLTLEMIERVVHNYLDEQPPKQISGRLQQA